MENSLTLRIGAAAAAWCYALTLGSVAQAQSAAPPTNLRGTVITYSGASLAVKSREDKRVDVALPKGYMVAGVAKGSLDSIKPGDFVGIASVEQAGGSRALEVLIFPPAMKGANEGSFGWDLKPKSTMTNAAVTNLVQGVKGRTVTLAYNGGQEKQITIPEGAPIVTFAPATASDLKPGAPVFIAGHATGEGKFTAARVVVGKNGVAPPM